MTPSDAAKKLGMSTQTLRLGLRKGIFPFGKAFITTEAKDSKTGKPRWTYYINEERLEKYLKGDDMHEKVENNTVVYNSSNND